jgi:hypothetical protein
MHLSNETLHPQSPNDNAKYSQLNIKALPAKVLNDDSVIAAYRDWGAK